MNFIPPEKSENNLYHQEEENNHSIKEFLLFLQKKQLV